MFASEKSQCRRRSRDIGAIECRIRKGGTGGGLSLYTDWQLKNWRALASHAPKNNRQEERALCLTRDTRFSRQDLSRMGVCWTAGPSIAAYTMGRTRTKGRVRSISARVQQRARAYLVPRPIGV